MLLRQTSADPLRPWLYRVFEAQLPRVHAGIAGGLRHEQSDHVVGQQMNPELLFVHLRRLVALGNRANMAFRARFCRRLDGGWVPPQRGDRRMGLRAPCRSGLDFSQAAWRRMPVRPLENPALPPRWEAIRRT